MTPNPQTWYQLSLHCNAEQAELFADMLQAIDALSVSMLDAKDQPLFQLQPEDQPLWQDTQVLALFNLQTEAEQAQNLLQSQSTDTLHVNIEKIIDQDWVRKNQQNFPAKAFGSGEKPLWVLPSWDNCDNFPQPQIRIDPGLAFGTGTHPTTSLCLRWLADHAPQNLQVIDYGCGSGILALACLSLGASHVTAVDHDMQALEASQNNLALNTSLSANDLAVYLPEACPQLQADVVIANILAGPLIEMADQLTALLKPGGTLLLSGMLSEEVANVVKHYPTLSVIKQLDLDEWACVSLSTSLSRPPTQQAY
ncbi:MAG: 50S ribosomal protein L11 methyltransferase [Coxiellaceae bacterium]|nr:50S ribosomal protein L11 methyltransferase [Coxiellaceae bacterium]